MKTLLLSLFTLFITIGFAQKQEVLGTVTARDGKPIEGAAIIDQRGIALDSTDANGVFKTFVLSGERFGVDVSGFELKWVLVEKGKRNYPVTLDIQVQEFESVVITRKNSEEALDIKNVNIIHYQPLDGAILTLKKEKKTYYLGMDSLQREGTSYPLTIEKPREIFFDCFQNAYVLNAEEAHQFAIVDTGLVIIASMPMELFNKYIRPCVAKFEDRLVMRSLTSLNQEYELFLYNKQEPKSIYQRRDQYGYQAAYEASIGVGKMVDPNDGDTLVDPIYLRRQQRRDVYGGHDTSEEFARARLDQVEAEMQVNQQAANTFNNPDSTGVRMNQSPKFGSQDAWRSSGGWAQAMASYMLFTQPIKIKSFQISDFLAVVDYHSSHVQILDHYGYAIKSFNYEVPSEVKNVMQDKATGYLYLYTRDKGNHKVYGLDAFTGKISYLKNFGGMPHTEQAIIYDGYLYYKVLERDFYGINRVRLPKMEFFAEVADE